MQKCLIKPHKHIFIAGLHRSGTSLLHQLLCEYDDVSGFKNTGAPEDEGQHLQSVFKAANQYGGAGAFAFGDECYMDENHELANPQSYQALMQSWGQYWDLSKPILIEKSPPNIIRSRFLQAIFPNSYFIFIIRHPIAVTMATSKWNDSPLDQLLEHWQKAHQIMQEDMGFLSNSLLIKYEDLTQNPNLIMQKIEDFIELPKTKHSIKIRNDVNEKYFAQWRLLKDSGKINITKINKLINDCQYVNHDISIC